MCIFNIVYDFRDVFNIANLVNLKYLHVQGNCFTKLPLSFTKLSNLEEFLCSKIYTYISLSSAIALF